MRTGRPVTVNIAKSEFVGINIHTNTLKALDKIRGLVPRSIYIRDLLEKHIQAINK